MAASPPFHLPPRPAAVVGGRRPATARPGSPPPTSATADPAPPLRTAGRQAPPRCRPTLARWQLLVIALAPTARRPSPDPAPTGRPLTLPTHPQRSHQPPATRHRRPAPPPTYHQQLQTTIRNPPPTAAVPTRPQSWRGFHQLWGVGGLGRIRGCSAKYAAGATIITWGTVRAMLGFRRRPRLLTTRPHAHNHITYALPAERPRQEDGHNCSPVVLGKRLRNACRHMGLPRAREAIGRLREGPQCDRRAQRGAIVGDIDRRRAMCSLPKSRPHIPSMIRA